MAPHFLLFLYLALSRFLLWSYGSYVFAKYNIVILYYISYELLEGENFLHFQNETWLQLFIVPWLLNFSLYFPFKWNVIHFTLWSIIYLRYHNLSHFYWVHFRFRHKNDGAADRAATSQQGAPGSSSPAPPPDRTKQEKVDGWKLTTHMANTRHGQNRFLMFHLCHCFNSNFCSDLHPARGNAK